MGKLFGPSLKELADKEIELRKANKENAGASVAFPVAKKKMPLFNKYFIILSSIILAFFLIMVSYVFYYNSTIPDADYDGFLSTMAGYIDENSSISEIEIIKRDMFNVYVKDDWYNSSEIEKLRFCNSVRDAIFVHAYQYDLLYEGRDYAIVSFYDTTNIEVADQSWGEFNILH